MDDSKTLCPYCRYEVPKGAIKCGHCGEFLKRKVSILLGLGIFFFPFIFSWFTLRRGYSTLARVIVFSWLLISLYFAFNVPDVSYFYSFTNMSSTPETSNISY
jgi:hypothetical protein